MGIHGVIQKKTASFQGQPTKFFCYGLLFLNYKLSLFYFTSGLYYQFIISIARGFYIEADPVEPCSHGNFFIVHKVTVQIVHYNNCFALSSRLVIDGKISVAGIWNNA